MILKNRKLIIWVGFAISAFFMYQSLKGIDLQEVLYALKKANLWMAIPLLSLYGLFFWIKAIRWRLLLLPVCSIKTKVVIPPIMIGTMGNNILPAHLGEFVRMYLLAKQNKIKNSSVLATLVLERIFDFLAVIFLLNIAFWIGASRPPELVNAGYVVGSTSILLLILIIVFIRRTYIVVEFFRKVTRFLPVKLRVWFLDQIETSSTGLKSIKAPNILIGIAITSIVQWIAIGLCQYIAVIALGLRVPVTASFVILAFTVIGMTLPAAPGFFGTIEFCFIMALIPYGVSSSEAFSSSIFYHLLNYVSVTIVGFYYIKRMGYSISRIKKVASSVGETNSSFWDAKSQIPFFEEKDKRIKHPISELESLQKPRL